MSAFGTSTQWQERPRFTIKPYRQSGEKLVDIKGVFEPYANQLTPVASPLKGFQPVASADPVVLPNRKRAVLATYASFAKSLVAGLVQKPRISFTL